LTQIKLAARSLPISSAGRPCGSSILKPHVNNPCVAPPSSIPAPVLHSTRAAHSQGAPPVAAISPMQPLLPDQPHATTPPALRPAAPILHAPVLPHPALCRHCAQSGQLSPASRGHSSSPMSHGATRRHQPHSFAPPCIGPPSSRHAPAPCSTWASQSSPVLPLLPPGGPRQRQRLLKLLDLICPCD
jgi:hypothetical protein